jgi:hypothetical protein
LCLRPSEFGFKELDRVQADINITVDDTVSYTMQALSDRHSESFQNLSYQACCILHHLGLMSGKQCFDRVSGVGFFERFLNAWECY